MPAVGISVIEDQSAILCAPQPTARATTASAKIACANAGSRNFTARGRQPETHRQGFVTASSCTDARNYPLDDSTFRAAALAFSSGNDKNLQHATTFCNSTRMSHAGRRLKTSAKNPVTMTCVATQQSDRRGVSETSAIGILSRWRNPTIADRTGASGVAILSAFTFAQAAGKQAPAHFTVRRSQR